MESIRDHLISTYSHALKDIHGVEIIVYKTNRHNNTLTLFTAYWKDQSGKEFHILGRSLESGCWESFNSKMNIEGLISDMEKLIFVGHEPDHPKANLFLLTNSKKWEPLVIDEGITI